MDREVNPNDVNRIVSDTVFKGVFTSENDIRIDGNLEGEVESKGKLVVGQMESLMVKSLPTMWTLAAP